MNPVKRYFENKQRQEERLESLEETVGETKQAVLHVARETSVEIGSILKPVDGSKKDG